MASFLRRLTGLILAIGLAVSPSLAQTAPSGTPAASAAGGFGHALAVSGDFLFAGEARSIHAPGRVLVYRWTGSNWEQHSELTAAEAEVGDGFGAALAVDGDRLVVGASSSNTAYVFERSGEAWTQTARLMPPNEVMSGPRKRAFAATVAIDGNTIAVNVTDPPFTFDPGKGAVVLFSEGSDGWSSTHVIAPEDRSNGDGFGEAIAVRESDLFISAPDADGRAGQVLHFAKENDEWTQQQTLTGMTGRFGASLLLDGDELLIGAPDAVDRRGAVQVARFSDGQWTVDGVMMAFDAPRDGRFGQSLARTDAFTWVGAPGAAKKTGAVYRFSRAEPMQSERLAHPASTPGDRLGGVLVAHSNRVVAAQPGDDYGARMTGSSAIAAFDGDADRWLDATISAPQRDIFTAVTGSKTPCAEGKASLFDCQDVDLLSFLPVDALSDTPGVRVNDVWGWTDPDTGRDYALVGRVDGTAFVDVTDPMQPTFVGELPATEGTEAKIWRDVKVYENHAFVVADNVGEHGMQVFDLTQLRNVAEADRPATFAATTVYDGIHSAHNVFINEDTGFAYVVGSNGGGQTCGGGLHMVDVREPTKPTFAGCYTDVGTGMTGTGTTHDTQCVVYQGPDERFQGQEICFASNETAVSIADVTDKSDPKNLSRAEHPRSAYIHQGWLTEDQQYLFVNDELDEMSGITDRTRTMVWDVSRLDDPQLVTEFFLPVAAADHNLYIRGDTMYQTNYTSGLRVVDVSDPTAPREIGHFDTLPFGPDAPVFEGAFSNYPFFDSGVVVVTSMQEGLFLLKKAEREL